jgi:hypothetical protein
VSATRYFQEQVLRKRPYLTVEMCLDIVASPLARAVQPDGRFRFWGEVTLPGEAEARIRRVVILEDGETLHNAFLDRDFRKDER